MLRTAYVVLLLTLYPIAIVDTPDNGDQSASKEVNVEKYGNMNGVQPGYLVYRINIFAFFTFIAYC